MLGKGTVVAKKAPEFSLTDQNGKTVSLSELIRDAAVLLVFYPGDFTAVCTKQLCSYRDSLDEFAKAGIRIVGISPNPPESHAEFARTYEFKFPLLTDPKHVTAKAYGCTSLLMLGNVSRAVFIVNKKGMILYRYVEPTAITHRKAAELIGIVNDLKKNGVI